MVRRKNERRKKGRLFQWVWWSADLGVLRPRWLSEKTKTRRKRELRLLLFFQVVGRPKRRRRKEGGDREGVRSAVCWCANEGGLEWRGRSGGCRFGVVRVRGEGSDYGGFSGVAPVLMVGAAVMETEKS
ncbi:hypothetical protein HAX54_047185 [Datura stramonium]|uniref:Uncharacterized protein n=1 Tax=Datura stramonium TaxID=4076 RepID=A0ABS8WHZ0_DATST|nr:hypothetical protein [Datura stramonium]